MYANLSLVHEALKDAVAKKLVMPAQKGSLVEYMVTTHKISQRQACKAVRLPQSSSRYKRRPKRR